VLKVVKNLNFFLNLGSALGTDQADAGQGERAAWNVSGSGIVN